MAVRGRALDRRRPTWPGTRKTPAAIARPGGSCAEIHERNEDLRRQVLADVAKQLAAKRYLPKGLSIPRAADVLFGLLSPQMYCLLVGDRGWSHAAFTDWLIGAIRRELWTHPDA